MINKSMRNKQTYSSTYIGKIQNCSLTLEDFIRKLGCVYIALAKANQSPPSTSTSPIQKKQKYTAYFYAHIRKGVRASRMRQLLSHGKFKVGYKEDLQSILEMEGVEEWGSLEGTRACKRTDCRGRDDVDQERRMMPYQTQGERGFWIFGEKGSGKKKTIANFCEMKNLELFVKKEINKYFNNYRGEKVIAMHNIKSEHFQYLEPYLLQWADSIPVKAESKTEGTFIELQHDYFFVSSSLNLDQFLEGQSQMTKNIFRRRFKEMAVEQLQHEIEESQKIMEPASTKLPCHIAP